MSESIEDLRARIDALDRRLLDALIERAAAARAVGKLKSRDAQSVFDPGRERGVIERLLEQNAGTFPPEALVAIFREIISASRALEQAMHVGFLGQSGGFAEFAAARRFGSSCRLTPYARAAGLFHDLEAGRLDYAMIPRDVGDEDAALRSFDLFLEHEVALFGEFVLRHGYALLGSAEARTLYGHPTALGRCREVIAARAGWTVVATGNSREAARLAAETSGAALGPAHLAAAFDLEVLEDPAEDDPAPRHRFLILSRTPAPRSERDRTALVVVLDNRPASLHRFVNAFAAEGVNLAWIEIRESRGRPWEHAFLVEVDGHREDAPLRRAVEAARACASHLQILGSYPVEA